MIKQIKQLESKYRECQDCKRKFILPMCALITESRCRNFNIYCPDCNSNNIAILDRKTYEKRRI